MRTRRKSPACAYVCLHRLHPTRQLWARLRVVTAFPAGEAAARTAPTCRHDMVSIPDFFMAVTNVQPLKQAALDLGQLFGPGASLGASTIFSRRWCRRCTPHLPRQTQGRRRRPRPRPSVFREGHAPSAKTANASGGRMATKTASHAPSWRRDPSRCPPAHCSTRRAAVTMS